MLLTAAVAAASLLPLAIALLLLLLLLLAILLALLTLFILVLTWHRCLLRSCSQGGGNAGKNAAGKGGVPPTYRAPAALRR